MSTIKHYGSTEGTRAEKKTLLSIDEETKTFSIEEDDQENNDTILAIDEYELPHWMINFVPSGEKVMYGYLVLGLICIVFIVLGSMSVFTGQLKWIPLIIVEIGLLFGSLSAMYGVYIWGSIDDQTNRLKTINTELEEENKKLSLRIDVLHRNTEVISDNLKLVEEQVLQLQETLQTGLKPIKDQLEVDLQAGNKDLQNYLKAFNDITFKIERDTFEQQRYAIIQSFFHSDMDDVPGLDEDEYKRFLTQINPQDRNWFKSKGTFEQLAGSDRLLDKQEFFHLVDEFVKFRIQERIKKRLNQSSAHLNI